MNKEKETGTTPEATPDQAAAAEKPNTLYHIELEMVLETSALSMKSKAPTVVLCGILAKAETAYPITIAETGPSRHVYIDYDMATDEAVVRTDASNLIMRGMLQMAYSMITQSQVTQRLNAARASAQIIRPGAGGFRGGRA